VPFVKKTLLSVSSFARANQQFNTAAYTRWYYSNKKHTIKCHVCQTLRDRAVGMVQQGASHADVARRLNCTRITVTMLQRIRQTGRTTDRPRSGRPRVTTPAEDRHIRVLHLRKRYVTATSTAATALEHQSTDGVQETAAK
jgi:transposase-like protein